VAEPSGTLELDGQDELMGALAALPPRQRAVLVLRYFPDLLEAEVGIQGPSFVALSQSQASRPVKSAELTRPTGISTQTFNLPAGNVCNTNKDCPDGSAQKASGGGGKDGMSVSQSDGTTAPGGQGSGMSVSK
jgi:hypothetical protein